MWFPGECAEDEDDRRYISYACSGCQAPTCTQPNLSLSSDSAFTWTQTRLYRRWAHAILCEAQVQSCLLFDVIKLSWIFLLLRKSSALPLSLCALLLAMIWYRFGELCFLTNSTDSQTTSSHTQSINKREINRRFETHTHNSIYIFQFFSGLKWCRWHSDINTMDDKIGNNNTGKSQISRSHCKVACVAVPGMELCTAINWCRIRALPIWFSHRINELK